MKMSKRVSVEKVHSGTTAICNLWPFASCVDLLAQGWQGLIVCERTSLLQEQGATVVASQPIIDRRFEKAPGIFDPGQEWRPEPLAERSCPSGGANTLRLPPVSGPLASW